MKIDRKGKKMLRFGHIVKLGDCGRVIVEFDENGAETDEIPVLVTNSGGDESANPIDIGAFVAVLLDDENPVNAVCLGAVRTAPRKSLNKKYHEFKDGTNLEYDREAHILTADVKGEIKASAQNTTLTSPLNVTENITSSKDVSDKNGTMQAIRDFINNHTHTNGNNGGNTGVPTEKI